MTKMLTRPSADLDLDSFLQSHSATTTDDDDDEGGAAADHSFPRRTVDDILNDSSSSSSSSSSSPPSSPPHFPSLPPQQTPKPPSLEHRSPSVRHRDPPAFARRLSGDLSSSSLFSSRRGSASRLFDGVKPHSKPGAALAAAAAASRSVPTPHAAAIKFRRAGAADCRDSAESGGAEIVGSGAEEGLSDAKLGGEDDGEEIRVGSRPDGGDVAESSHESDEFHSVQEMQIKTDEDAQTELPYLGFSASSSAAVADEQEVGSSLKFEIENAPGEVGENSTLSNSNNVVEETASSPSKDKNENYYENAATLDSAALDEQKVASTPDNENEGSALMLKENISHPTTSESQISGKIDFEKMELNGKNIDKELTLPEDNFNSRSDANQLFEDMSIHLDIKRASKKIAKKLRSAKRPLELAEELEKKYASSGLHWEEGAAAQPMRLEGIRRGPPAVGYLQIDPENGITHTISSQAFRREHGSPQTITVHLNFIAVGTLRGVILIFPSRYSAHHADNMDGKMSLLGSQGERTHSPVTSMCFNQQGDLLLAGYGDGHLTVWDVQKAAAVKTITGEHTVPVIHTLFLGQDSQVTRQFKAVTGDCKGLVLLHSFSVVPLLNRFSIKTQCLLDPSTGTVLSASPLLLDESYGGSLTSIQGNPSVSTSGLGGMVGGVVGGETGWKLFSEGSSLVEEGVVIFVTHQTALVARLTPSLEVYAQLSRPDGVREGSMPYTAWKCVSHLHGSSTEVEAAKGSDKASLLAIAWDRKVLVAKLVKPELKVYKEWTLESTVIGVAWLDDRMLVILTLRGQLFLYTKEGVELHRTSFMVDGVGGDDVITYHTHFTNIFGNPEKAYHNSVAVRGATVYILGSMHLVVSRLLPWKERIQVLQKAGDWMGALDMAIRLYDGLADGVIDLPRAIGAIREAIMQYLVDLILSYVDVVFSYISVAFCNQVGRDEETDGPTNKRSSAHTEIQEQYSRVGGVAVEFCVHINRADLLFDDIFSKFVAVQQGGTFLELLEPYILKDMLGCLPPEIMQALVEHYSSKGWLQRVEQCVLHMDISSLDFNQVVRLCREHGLYGALIYLFNRGLDDFNTPLEELLVVLQNNQRMTAVVIGYRMLVYLKHCFLGLAFPPGHGTIPSSRLPLLRMELLQFLLADSSSMSSQVGRRFKSPNGAFPNLCHLLWLDTEASLEVLKCAFVEEEMSLGTPGDADIEKNDKHDFSSPDNQKLNAQNIVNTLVNIIDMEMSEVVGSSDMDDDGHVEVWPSKKDIGHILEFIASFVAQENITISKCTLNHILEYMTEGDPPQNIPRQKTEVTQRREKQVLALIKVLPETDWDCSYLLNLCEKAQFYQVCGFIHATKGEYLAALDSYMKDVDEPSHAFAFINSMLQQLKDSESSDFKSAVISRIAMLVNLSREATAFLIIDQFSKESDHILSELQAYPESLFLYLKTVVEVHLSGTLNFSQLKRGDTLLIPYATKLRVQPNDLEAYMERISNFPKLLRYKSIHVTDEMAEVYLELLCQYEPKSVLKFLQTFENYRVEHCLRLCQEYGITDAAAFLLERVGDVGSALALILSSLGEKLHMLDVSLEDALSEVGSNSLIEQEQFNTILRMKEVNVVHEVLYASIGLCQRNTPRLDSQESESLWFLLLDSFCKPLRKLYDDRRVYEGRNGDLIVGKSGVQETQERGFRLKNSKFDIDAHILKRILSRFIQEIVEGMVGYVPLPSIMAKLLSDNGNQEFGDFKQTILGMLGTYRYEKQILDTAKSLIEDDTYCTMTLLKKGACHAYSPKNVACCICDCSCSKDSSPSSIRIFSCGHATHIHCDFLANEGSSRDYSAGCPICMPKTKSSQGSGKTVLLDDGLVKHSLQTTKQPQGVSTVQYLHESDIVERPFCLQQLSRFEILSNVTKSRTSLQVDAFPQLRLAPPDIYHDKVKKGSDLLMGESSSVSMKTEKPSKLKQMRESKTRGSSIRFPLKPSIFSTEKRRK